MCAIAVHSLVLSLELGMIGGLMLRGFLLSPPVESQASLAKSWQPSDVRGRPEMMSAVSFTGATLTGRAVKQVVGLIWQRCLNLTLTFPV